MGLLALLLGVLVYAVDRRAGHSLLIPMAGALAGGPGFGALAFWLPSFVHPLAFGLFTAALLPPRSAWRPLACVLWGIVNAAFEFGQQPQVSVALASMMPGDTGAAAAPWRQAPAAYFMAGTFDPADLMASALGTALALVALQAASNHRERFDAS